MPHITDSENAQNVAQMEQLFRKGYVIHFSDTGYSVVARGDHSIVASFFSRYVPAPPDREQFVRNFLAAAITAARQHAGELPPTPMPPPLSLQPTRPMLGAGELLTKLAESEAPGPDPDGMPSDAQIRRWADQEGAMHLQHAIARNFGADPQPDPRLTALRKIKVICLTAKDGPSALATITRICIDAGIRENYTELEDLLSPK